MSEEFFQYVSHIWMKKGRQNFVTGTKQGDTVHHAVKKMLKTLEYWPKVATDEEYVIKYRFTYDFRKRCTIKLISDGSFTILLDGVKMVGEEAKKMLEMFLDRFYHIDIEKLIKDIIKFPQERELPQKLRLQLFQVNSFLVRFQQELQKAKIRKKIAAIRNTKLIKENNLMSADELKTFLVTTFPMPEHQVFIDSDIYAQDKIDVLERKKPKKKTKKHIKKNLKPDAETKKTENKND